MTDNEKAVADANAYIEIKIAAEKNFVAEAMRTLKRDHDSAHTLALLLEACAVELLGKLGKDEADKLMIEYYINNYI